MGGSGRLPRPPPLTCEKRSASWRAALGPELGRASRNGSARGVARGPPSAPAPGPTRVVALLIPKHANTPSSPVTPAGGGVAQPRARPGPNPLPFENRPASWRVALGPKRLCREDVATGRPHQPSEAQVQSNPWFNGPSKWACASHSKLASMEGGCRHRSTLPARLGPAAFENRSGSSVRRIISSIVCAREYLKH